MVLSGALCKRPVVRRTPLGRSICDLLLAVNRAYGRADYLPCIAWGSLAACCGRMSVGDRLRLEGRLQSRQYRKVVDGEEVTRVAYEVSVMNLLEEEAGTAPLGRTWPAGKEPPTCWRGRERNGYCRRTSGQEESKRGRDAFSVPAPLPVCLSHAATPGELIVADGAQGEI